MDCYVCSRSTFGLRSVFVRSTFGIRRSTFGLRSVYARATLVLRPVMSLAVPDVFSDM